LEISQADDFWLPHSLVTTASLVVKKKGWMRKAKESSLIGA
jgi:hypothetical protein